MSTHTCKLEGMAQVFSLVIGSYIETASRWEYILVLANGPHELSHLKRRHLVSSHTHSPD